MSKKFKSEVLIRADDDDWMLGRSDYLIPQWYMCAEGLDAWFYTEDALEIRLVVSARSFKGAYAVRLGGSSYYDGHLEVYDPIEEEWSVKTMYMKSTRFAIDLGFEPEVTFYAGVEIIK